MSTSPAPGAGFDPTLIQQRYQDGARDDGLGPGRAIPEAPLAEARNHSPFPCQYFQTVDPHGDVFHVMALRITYDMNTRQSDAALAYADEQTPLATEDRWSGQVGVSSPLWESDFAPYKPRCDVLVVNAVSRPPFSDWQQTVGRHLHSGEPTRPTAKRWACGVGVQWTSKQGKAHNWGKQITVTGPRRFGLISLSSPDTAAQVPIDWCHAFGGEIREPSEDLLRRDGSLQTRAGATRHLIDERNPVGCGLDSRSGAAAPQLEESALNPYHGGLTQGRYPPVSLTAVGRAWLPRRTLAGTYDNAWLKDQWPLSPLDFNYAYWNCAPEDQQIDYPPPGARIALLNLYGAQQTGPAAQPDGNEWRGRLPKAQPFVLWRLHSGTMFTRPLHLDTLVIDMGAQRIYATYRATLSAQCGVRVVEARIDENPNDNDNKAGIGRG